MKSNYFSKEETERALQGNTSNNNTRPFTPNRRKSINYVDPRAFVKPDVLNFRYETKEEAANKTVKDSFSFQNLYETPQ